MRVASDTANVVTRARAGTPSGSPAPGTPDIAHGGFNRDGAVTITNTDAVSEVPAHPPRLSRAFDKGPRAGRDTLRTVQLARDKVAVSIGTRGSGRNVGPGARSVAIGGAVMWSSDKGLELA